MQPLCAILPQVPAAAAAAEAEVAWGLAAGPGLARRGRVTSWDRGRLRVRGVDAEAVRQLLAVQGELGAALRAHLGSRFERLEIVR